MTDKPDTTHFTVPKPHKLVASMPAHLKDPANYEKIQKAIYEAGATRCSHNDVTLWAACKKCEKSRWNRKEMMERLGFKSSAHYMIWLRIHKEIKERVKLPKYNSI